MSPRLVIALLAFALAIQAAEPPPPADIVLGKRQTFASAILGEQRALQIFVPDNYEVAKATYPVLPVLYLLDGRSHFLHVAGVVDYLIRKRRIPPLIIVGVDSADRYRDFTPTNGSTYLGKPLPDMETSGRAANYLRFLREELVPHIDRSYRTAPFRILAGQSLAGLFVIHALQSAPEAFNGWIASSPSLWWDEEVALRTTGPIGRPRQFLFLSVGNEGGPHEQAIGRLAGQLRERAAPDFNWSFKAYPTESHGTVPHPSFHTGLQHVFANWELPYRPDEAEPLLLPDLLRHYERLNQDYGFDIRIPLDLFKSVADELIFRERWDDAIAVYRNAATHFPQSAEPHSLLGRAHIKQGDRAAAIAAYEKALLINPKHSRTKQALDRLTKLAPSGAVSK